MHFARCHCWILELCHPLRTTHGTSRRIVPQVPFLYLWTGVAASYELQNLQGRLLLELLLPHVFSATFWYDNQFGITAYGEGPWEQRNTALCMLGVAVCLGLVLKVFEVISRLVVCVCVLVRGLQLCSVICCC